MITRAINRYLGTSLRRRLSVASVHPSKRQARASLINGRFCYGLPRTLIPAFVNRLDTRSARRRKEISNANCARLSRNRIHNSMRLRNINFLRRFNINRRRMPAHGGDQLRLSAQHHSLALLARNRIARQRSERIAPMLRTRNFPPVRSPISNSRRPTWPTFTYHGSISRRVDPRSDLAASCRPRFRFFSPLSVTESRSCGNDITDVDDRQKRMALL